MSKNLRIGRSNSNGQFVSPKEVGRKPNVTPMQSVQILRRAAEKGLFTVLKEEEHDKRKNTKG